MEKAKDRIARVIIGKDFEIELLFTALLADGHVLLESVPGSGKTKLAKSFAKVIHGAFNRIQFTPDVLPSDVTGIQYYNPKTQEFQLRSGPVMTNILLVDEINRATPKTQSSLLEVMEEKQTTVDGDTLHITPPFCVLATQNPVEGSQGTFPLPEAQLDRFLFKIDMGYPELEEEKRILQTYRQHDPLQELEAVLSLEEVLHLKKSVQNITVSEAAVDYLLAIIHETRKNEDVELGVSTRGALALMRASQAQALLHDRNFVTPQDIKKLAPYVIEHRLVLSIEGTFRKTKKQVLEEIMNEVQVPVEEGGVR
ncbi:MoxR family ATPase [Halobacillus salinarum]|uniref:MoxR family ATPase n=1 Tax=Halobacillus salinarum TaxID=2932257 RepID=A0ABY4ERZ2_9BACI|nr:MoxR family ATPase [Halobacillus salinarum]UOQ46424.1 MoxR family ATPase [Halobacillus salinarum]